MSPKAIAFGTWGVEEKGYASMTVRSKEPHPRFTHQSAQRFDLRRRQRPGRAPEQRQRRPRHRLEATQAGSVAARPRRHRRRPGAQRQRRVANRRRRELIAAGSTAARPVRTVRPIRSGRIPSRAPAPKVPRPCATVPPPARKARLDCRPSPLRAAARDWRTCRAPPPPPAPAATGRRNCVAKDIPAMARPVAVWLIAYKATPSVSA